MAPFFCLLGSRALSADPVYSIQTLGSLGSGAAMATGMNNSGAAVGWVTDAQGNVNPTSFSNGQATALGIGGQANAINDAGVAVGTSFPGNSPGVFEWSNGNATALGIAGYGTTINNAGQVAGGYIAPGGQLHAFTWSGGTLVDLGTLGGSWSSAYGINSLGQAGGTSLTAGGTFHAFFSDGGGLEDLGTLGGGNSYGMALNSAGQVVGSAQNAGGYSQAFKWDGQQMIGLGTLGGTQSYAYGINSAGDIVGNSWTRDGVMHAFVYINGVMLDLNSLVPIGSGWTIDSAYGITDSGEILAQGTYRGQRYAIDLERAAIDAPLDVIATPEPVALALTLVGLLVIVGFRKSG
jgi:probable HAF family extracellular repeat protein